MKKLFLFILLFIPVGVFAKGTCDYSNIIISDLEVVESNGYITEKEVPFVDGVNINTDLKLYDVVDSVLLPIVLKLRILLLKIMI